MKNRNRILTLLLLGMSVFFTTGCMTDSSAWLPTPKVHLSSSQSFTPDYSYQQPDYQPAQPTLLYGAIPNISGKTIIVDPGHGGKQPGAVKNGIHEKHINLAISKKLASILQDAGCRVIMTRSSDVYISLDSRAAMAERYKVDLLISIHADSFSNPNTTGATVLTGSRASRKSKRAAWILEAELEKGGIECRGSRPKKLRVCDGHSRPAILVETGFLTNRQEAMNLTTNWYQDKIATAIARGVARYLNSN